MANVKQQLAALVNSSGPSQKDRIEKYDIFTVHILNIKLFRWPNVVVERGSV